MSINKAFDTPSALAAQNARYESKLGDPRRSGRATLPARELVAFVDHSGRIEARLGVVSVGMISINPADVSGRHPFFWVVNLSGLPDKPRPAGDVEAAKRAIAHHVRQWCDAAGLVQRVREVGR